MEEQWMAHVALRSSRGKRRNKNEDAFYLNGDYPSLDTMNTEANRKFVVEGSHTLWAVCDGIGGLNHGEIASQRTVQRLDELRSRLPGRDFSITVQDWIAKVDEEVLHCAEGGGCTIALLFIDDHTVNYAHVGDSRIYRLHEGLITQLTRDHTKVEMLLSAGIIQPSDVASHPERHVIVRSIGASPEIICTATIGEPIPLCNGDRYLLCSDGITDMLTNEQIRDIAGRAEDAATCSENLYSAAMDNGGRDNLTIVTLDIELQQNERADNTFNSEDKLDRTIREDTATRFHINDSIEMNLQTHIDFSSQTVYTKVTVSHSISQ